MPNNRRRKQGKKLHNTEEERMVKGLDDLADHMEFVKHVPKKLRDALLRGASAKEIYEEFSQEAAARAVLIALTEKDAAKALSAIKSIEDRHMGKPTEKRETTHKFDELPDEEIDSILESKYQQVMDDDDEDRSEQAH